MYAQHILAEQRMVRKKRDKSGLCLYTRKGDNKRHGDVQIEKYAACKAASKMTPCEPSAYMGNTLLGVCLSRSLWLRGQLKYRCLLTHTHVC